MSKFHINRKGVPAPCRSQSGKCPLGGTTGAENHFESEQEAQKAADKINESQHGLLPGKISGDKTGKLTKQQELMMALRNPETQYKLTENKVNELEASRKKAEDIMKAADNPEDRRLAGYDLMRIERELAEAEGRLAKKKGELDNLI